MTIDTPAMAEEGSRSVLGGYPLKTSWKIWGRDRPGHQLIGLITMAHMNQGSAGRSLPRRQSGLAYRLTISFGRHRQSLNLMSMWNVDLDCGWQMSPRMSFTSLKTNIRLIEIGR